MRGVVEVDVAGGHGLVPQEVDLAGPYAVVGQPGQRVGDGPGELRADDDEAMPRSDAVDSLDSARQGRRVPERRAAVAASPGPELVHRAEVGEPLGTVPGIHVRRMELRAELVVVARHPARIEVRQDAVHVDAHAQAGQQVVELEVARGGRGSDGLPGSPLGGGEVPAHSAGSSMPGRPKSRS